jgi:ABC-2 type transport system ATP-binding protein
LDAVVPATIEITGLRVDRGGSTVIDGLSLAIDGGVVTGLLGPSGGGKSTLMRAIVGVQIVAEGDVRVLGLPAGCTALRTRVGYVTQSPSVYADLSVRENLVYFGRVLGVSRSRAGEVIERVGLTDTASRLVGKLSGGQKARVSLATALLGEPEVLVLDEPTVGLDPVLRRDLWDFFQELASGGTTLLVSSHVMDEAARCERLLLLREGAILADLPPGELLRRTGAPDLDAAFLRLVESEASR